MANARRIALATRQRKPTLTAMTTGRVKSEKAVKADAAVVAVAVAMTVARVWTKPVTRFLRSQARMKPMDRQMLKAAHAKAQTTRAAMAAAHATAMAASAAHVVAAMPAQKTRKGKLQAISKCANPSA
jgi:long-subunit acyl-CoA synthetase (AMP-forming)